MHIKHVVPTNDTQLSRTRMWPFSATLLLIAGGTWLTRALQARSMGLMPVSIGTHSRRQGVHRGTQTRSQSSTIHLQKT